MSRPTRNVGRNATPRPDSAAARRTSPLFEQRTESIGTLTASPSRTIRQRCSVVVWP